MQCQGQTIKPPIKILADLNESFQSAMAYVILSRIVNMTQLYLKQFDQKKIYCNEAAKTEAMRIKKNSLTKVLTKWDTSESTKISSLNVRSLNKHWEDLKNDCFLNKSDIIFISESRLNKDLEEKEVKFPNFPHQFYLNKGSEGVALLSKRKPNDTLMFNNNLFSMIAVSYEKFALINVYRFAKNKLYQDFTDQLLNIIEKYMDQTLVICGDFNIDLISECNNVFTKKLKSLGFNYLVTRATHNLGGTIDHVYFKCRTPNITVELNKLHPLYYSDHCAISFFVNYKETGTSQPIE